MFAMIANRGAVAYRTRRLVGGARSRRSRAAVPGRQCEYAPRQEADLGSLRNQLHDESGDVRASVSRMSTRSSTVWLHLTVLGTLSMPHHCSPLLGRLTRCWR